MDPFAAEFLATEPSVLKDKYKEQFGTFCAAFVRDVKAPVEKLQDEFPSSRRAARILLPRKARAYKYSHQRAIHRIPCALHSSVSSWC